MASDVQSGGNKVQDESVMLDEAVWPGTEIENWRAFGMQAAELIDEVREGRLLLFRGQPEQWRLRSALLRCLPPGIAAADAQQAEWEALEHFQSQVHLHYSTGALPFGSAKPHLMDWWALMQHHHAPTRLLDWTASLYVAAYFAAESVSQSDGVILVIDGERIAQSFRSSNPSFDWREDDLKSDTSDGLLVFTPYFKTPRLAAHQGYFTMALNPLAEQDELLRKAGAIVRRWIIKSKFKSELLHQLRIMNVAAHTLFPGLDGLGRSAGELIRAPSTRRHNP